MKHLRYCRIHERMRQMERANLNKRLKLNPLISYPLYVRVDESWLQKHTPPGLSNDVILECVAWSYTSMFSIESSSLSPLMWCTSSPSYNCLPSLIVILYRERLIQPFLLALGWLGLLIYMYPFLIMDIVRYTKHINGILKDTQIKAMFYNIVLVFICGRKPPLNQAQYESTTCHISPQGIYLIEHHLGQ